MTDTKDKKDKSPYYIFVYGGDRMYLLGRDGRYLKEYNADEAMIFDDKIDAITYVEKHGLQRFSTIRKVKYKN